jgi:hypothetical protein
VTFPFANISSDEEINDKHSFSTPCSNNLVWYISVHGYVYNETTYAQLPSQQHLELLECLIHDLELHAIA